MAFYSSDFIFDGIPSEMYDLHITSRDDGADVTTESASNVTPYLQEIFRRPVQYLYGVQQTPILSFPVTLNSPNEITATDFGQIGKWLFGTQNYKKLQVCQGDMRHMYFNCFLTAPQIQRVGNLIVGCGATVTCDAPWGWEFPKTETFSYTLGGYTIASVERINNTSDNTFYTYPTMSFTMNVFGGELSIINQDDDDREFLFTGLSPNEVITIDNDLQMITSSISGVYRLLNFNKNWMRYVSGINNLEISGNIASVSFTHQFARKIGG